MTIKSKITVEQFIYALSVQVGFVVSVIGIVELLTTVVSQVQARSILRDQMILQTASLIVGMALVNLSIAVKALVENRRTDILEESNSSGDIDGKK